MIKTFMLITCIIGLVATWALAGTNYPITDTAGANPFNHKTFTTKVNAAFNELSAAQARRQSKAAFTAYSARAQARFVAYSTNAKTRSDTKATLNAKATFTNLSAAKVDASGKCYFRNNTTFWNMGGVKFAFTIKSTTSGILPKGRRY